MGHRVKNRLARLYRDVPTRNIRKKKADKNESRDGILSNHALNAWKSTPSRPKK
jgi:hypothetical protein